MKTGFRGKLFFYARVAASIAMLAILLPRLDLSSAIPRSPEASAMAYLVAFLLVLGIGMGLSAWRWQRVLAILDAPVSLGELLSHHLAGQFVGNFLPSTIGGDLLRVWRVSPSVGTSETAFASVVLERLTGWLVLPLLTLTGLALHPAYLDLDLPTELAVGFATGTLTLLGLVIVVAASRRLSGRFSHREGISRFVGAVHLGIQRFKQSPARTLAVIGAALVYQVVMVFSVYLAARTAQIDVSLTWALTFAPVVAMAQVLPISFNGLGLREGALVILLAPLAVSPARAVAVGLLIHTGTFLLSLCGAPAFAVGQRPRTQVI